MPPSCSLANVYFYEPSHPDGVTGDSMRWLPFISSDVFSCAASARGRETDAMAVDRRGKWFLVPNSVTPAADPEMAGYAPASAPPDGTEDSTDR